jgi:integrase
MKLRRFGGVRFLAAEEPEARAGAAVRGSARLGARHDERRRIPSRSYSQAPCLPRWPVITLLASRGRRRRSLSLLTVGCEIFRDGDRYRVELAPHQVKTNKPDRFDIGPRLTSYLDLYLREIRPALLGDCRHDALWVGQSGRPLTLKGLGERVHVLSRKRFGYSFGPHAFRHAISTMLAEHEPQNPGLAAAVLGISPAINMAHYNRAKQMAPLKNYAALIDRRKAEAMPSQHRRSSPRQQAGQDRLGYAASRNHFFGR